MKKYELNNYIKPKNIVFATTISEYGYDEERLILLENMPNTEFGNFVLAERSHCSCYGFEETVWDCWELSLKELKKILEENYLDKCRINLKKYLAEN